VSRLRRFLASFLPWRLVDWYRRRRALKRFLKGLSMEVLERERGLEYVEGRVAASTRGFYHQIVADVLARTDIILQELDRRIEGVAARTDERLAGWDAQISELREEVERLRKELESAVLPEETGPTAIAE
jgi:hypothetical protein